MGYKITIDEDYFRNYVSIYAETQDDSAYLVYKNGGIVRENKIEGQEYEPFLKIFITVYKAIEKQIIENLEHRGGAPTQQYMRGRVEQLEKEVEWLRNQVENIPYINSTPIETIKKV